MSNNNKNGSVNSQSRTLFRSSPQEELPKGLVADHALPHSPYSELWDAIQLNDDQKDRILAQALLAFTLRGTVNSARLPMHGLILLVGRPGTGKTSLARGLASRTAESLPNGPAFRFVEVEPHALASAGLGKSQQGIRTLLHEVIAERAAQGPVIVLLDEVETLAADRTKLSLEANPIDVHRATDAVLAGLDFLASRYPKLLFIATSNFPDAIDAALMSRADLVETIPLPGPDVALSILTDSVNELIRHFPRAAGIISDPKFVKAGRACAGLDGRQIRKLVISACRFDKRTALDPGLLTASNLLRAVEIAQHDSSRTVKGVPR